MTATMTTADEGKQRNPRYPAFSLEQALNAVKKVYEKDRRIATMRDVAAKHMGYSGNNGSSARMLASVIQYGLLEDVGQGKVRVTELSEAIIHPKDEHERSALLNKAIYHPKTFNFFLNKHGLERMPSDDTLKTELIREMHFTAEAAADFLKSLKQSIGYVRTMQPATGFAGAERDTKNNLPPNETQDSRETKLEVEEPQKERGEQWIDGPLSNQTRAELRVWGPIGINEVKRLKRWLDNIVKPWADFHVLEDDEKSNAAE